MKFGVMSFNTEYTIRADDLARAVEERGLESVWFPEHTHIPASRRTPFPGGGELPKEYIHMSDPFTSAAAAAAVTKRIMIGTGICLVPQHEPLALAKTVATLDRLSNGRESRRRPEKALEGDARARRSDAPAVDRRRSLVCW
jgi:alkanesulfonate monooxygenase SsuD/methylene tetrahydromethanopterin reductase-like flavin-dependent oxidoreductase (luciferase family)